MLIALSIFLGFLLFDLFVACRIYFRKDRQFKQYECQSNYIGKEELDLLLRSFARSASYSSVK